MNEWSHWMVVLCLAVLLVSIASCAGSITSETTTEDGGSAAATAPTDSVVEPLEPLCPEGETPQLDIVLDEGNIRVELFPRAAPLSVAGVAQLAREGYYDGRTFDYTHPRLEIVSSLEEEGQEEHEVLLLAKEIDAVALGLDQVKLENIDQAMDAFQFEIFPAFAEDRKAAATPKMKEWIATWEDTTEADFLVGTSRLEMYEAMGFVYRSGLESRPVTRGSVALRPASKTHSTPRLSIALRDIPKRTGLYVVIGHVADGLDLAEDVSIRPLNVAPGQRSYDYRPREPVVISTIDFECRETSDN